MPQSAPNIQTASRHVSLTDQASPHHNTVSRLASHDSSQEAQTGHAPQAGHVQAQVQSGEHSRAGGSPSSHARPAGAQAPTPPATAPAKAAIWAHAQCRAPKWYGGRVCLHDAAICNISRLCSIWSRGTALMTSSGTDNLSRVSRAQPGPKPVL